MSHIVVDAREYTTSTGRYTFRLLQYLEKIDTERDYTILLKPEDMTVYEFTNPRFHKVVCPYKEFSFGEQLGFKRQLAGLKPDLVHFAMVQQPILYQGKVVTTIHDLTMTRFINKGKNKWIFLIKQQVYKLVIIWSARKSQAVITPSEYVKSDVVNYTHIDPTKISVTYEAADPITEAAVPLAGLQNKRFIMYVGRPTVHKNLERLVEAFGQLQSKYPDLILVLAGKKDVNYQQIEATIPAALKPSIFFTDFVSEGQLRWLYEHTMAYIFPSLSEGFGLPGLEAMVHGAPVISSNASCLPEIYGNGARYFDPLDVPAMAAAIETVLSDETLRQKLIAAGRQQVAQYSWKRTAEQTLAVYNQVLSQA